MQARRTAPQVSRRRGVVEFEAVMVTAVMFPLAVALFTLAVRGYRLLYDVSVTFLESPYL
jgi:hypothetical protein